MAGLAPAIPILNRDRRNKPGDDRPRGDEPGMTRLIRSDRNMHQIQETVRFRLTSFSASVTGTLPEFLSGLR
jgi:hypothetical protein